VAKPTYHHGDLRRALMSAAVASIEEAGPAALSLRDLARRAGVSHAAPAHHFGDKAGLLTALAAEGYELLAADLVASRATNGSFLELGVTYVRFAVSHRAHFEVMFRPDLHRPDDPDLAVARRRTGDALYAGAAEWSDAGPVGAGHGPAGAAGEGVRTAGEGVREAGLAAWSLAHGFAALWLSGSLPDSGTDPGDSARAVLRQLEPGAEGA